MAAAVTAPGAQLHSREWAETLVGLPTLMRRTAGVASVGVALIDGPVATSQPHLARDNIQVLSGTAACQQPNSLACQHGTLVAGLLHARRDSPVPGICPGCTLLVRPIFTEASVPGPEGLPSAPVAEAAAALLEAIEAGARIVNLSVALAEDGTGAGAVVQALDAAAHRGVLVVAAAGNQGTLGSTVLTRHPWVIPVVACDRSGRVMAESNLGAAIGLRGLAAPGEEIESLAAEGGTATFGGTSAAVPFVAGALALLCSVFPTVAAVRLRLAIAGGARRRSVAPPLLDSRNAYQSLLETNERGQRT